MICCQGKQVNENSITTSDEERRKRVILPQSSNHCFHLNPLLHVPYNTMCHSLWTLNKEYSIETDDICLFQIPKRISHQIRVMSDNSSETKETLSEPSHKTDIDITFQIDAHSG